VAVSGSGQVLSWGANQHGLLGLGPAAAQNVTSPAPIPHCFGAHVSLATMRLLAHVTPELSQLDRCWLHSCLSRFWARPAKRRYACQPAV